MSNRCKLAGKWRIVNEKMVGAVLGTAKVVNRQGQISLADFLLSLLNCAGMNPQEQTANRAWVTAWRENAVALEEIRTQELRALTEEQTGRLFAEMTVDTNMIWISPERAGAVGLIEQQRLFLCSDEHPARHQCRS